MKIVPYQIPTAQLALIPSMFKDGGSAECKIKGVTYWVNRGFGDKGTDAYGAVYRGKCGDKSHRLNEQEVLPVLVAFVPKLKHLLRAELAALDSPKLADLGRRVPLCAANLPTVCWIKFNTTTPNHYLVISVKNEFVEFDHQRVSFRRLMDHEYLYSSDRVHWYPCHKTI